MGRHCFNDWMNCGILISKINIAWILCLHDLCFIRITYDNTIMYEQFSVWSLIKNVIWTYSLWAIYILRLCAQTCTPNRHALKRVFSSLSEWALPMPETKIWDHFSIQIYPLLVGNMASETTFDTWKVVFSWGQMRKMALSQKDLCSRFLESS